MGVATPGGWLVGFDGLIEFVHGVEMPVIARGVFLLASTRNRGNQIRTMGA